MSDHSTAATLRVAQHVLDVLHEHGTESIVIGALALAVHGYPRATEDLDLAVSTPLSNLKRVAAALEDRGYEVEFREPDAQDPLGGVIDVRAPGADLVQVVNFDSSPAAGFPRLVHDAISTASALGPGSSLRVVDPYHLVVFKLYAGGAKSKLDILELLDRHPALDVERLRELCAGYRLDSALERVLALAEPSDG